MAATKHTFKLVLLGDASVGKTALAIHFVKGTFSEYTESTIGASFLNQHVKLGGNVVIRFQIWDTAGQERFHSLAPMYYRGAQAAIVVYDITSMASFERAQDWVAELHTQGDADVEVCFVGNKTDLEDARQVDAAVAKQYCDENNLHFMESSAKTGHNVSEMFMLLARTLAAKAPEKPAVNRGQQSLPQRLDDVGGAGSQKPAEKTGCSC